MKPYDYPIISIESSPDFTGQVICVRYLIDHPGVPPKMMRSEQKWILSAISGFPLIDKIVDVAGRKICVNGGVYEYPTPEERELIRQRRFLELARLRPFTPTLPVHFEAMGLEVPDDDHEWIMQEKRRKT